jgi:RNA polymerase sigma-70 factor (ECF subfamily)
MTPVLAHRARTDRSFERLYQRHVGDVYRYALAVMRNQPDAEDVTQTTFLNAYRAYQRGERPERPKHWLIAIAHNVCRQRFRQSARRPAEVSFDDDVADPLVRDDDVPTGEDIRRALGHLAFNQRAALVMRELEGRSYAEIAEILGLSTSAVETLIFRARRALREQLETSLTCGEAELAISRQLDRRLGRQEKAALRAHLRQCPECASFARRQRAQRTALRSLVAVPLPASLSSFFGGTAAVGTGLAVKAAVAVTVGAVVGAGAYEGTKHAPWNGTRAPGATTPAIVQDVPATARVPAPREHLPLVNVASSRSAGAHARGRAHAAAATAHTRGRGHTKAAPGAAAAGHRRGNANGHAKTSHRGGAGVAARHVDARPVPVRAVPRAHPAPPAHPARRSHPVRRLDPVLRPRPLRSAPSAPAPKAHPVKSELPGSYGAGPPSGENGKKSNK